VPRKKTFSFLKHELLNSHSRAISLAGVMNLGHVDEDCILTTHQEKYVQDIARLNEIVMYCLSDSIELCRSDTLKEDFGKSMILNACDIIANLKIITTYMPITQKVTEFKELSKKRKDILELMDPNLEDLFSKYNEFFSKKTDGQIYAIHNKVLNYYATHLYDENNKDAIHLEMPDMANLFSRFNYYSSVIFPILDNADHAFNNKDNDIYKRSGSPDFMKKMSIISEKHHEDNMIEVIISDNGFGIRPEIKDRIFDEGVSSKTDTNTEHGLGLYMVKSFVEEQGGKIWVESELGKRTSFHFTIPYDRREGENYIKD